MKLILSHKFGDKVRGSYKVSERFCKNFNNLKLISDNDFNLKELEKYEHVFFRTQSPYSYTFRLGLKELSNPKHTFFIRSEYNKPFVRSVSNGFNYYKNDPKIKFYFPMITDFSCENSCDELVFGFYSRKGIAPDSYQWFCDFLRDNTIPCKVFTMGDYILDLTRYTSVTEHHHTYDNIEFFSSISHYVYPESHRFVDPFPHSVLEAIQSNVQLIIPSWGNRDFKDGIDDLKSIFCYHTHFIEDFFLHNTPLKFSMFEDFYHDTLYNDMEYTFDRDYFKTFYDWIDRCII